MMTPTTGQRVRLYRCGDIIDCLVDTPAVAYSGDFDAGSWWLWDIKRRRWLRAFPGEFDEPKEES
jgi:hypothetical protein